MRLTNKKRNELLKHAEKLILELPEFRELNKQVTEFESKIEAIAQDFLANLYTSEEQAVFQKYALGREVLPGRRYQHWNSIRLIQPYPRRDRGWVASKTEYTTCPPTKMRLHKLNFTLHNETFWKLHKEWTELKFELAKKVEARKRPYEKLVYRSTTLKQVVNLWPEAADVEFSPPVRRKRATSQRPTVDQHDIKQISSDMLDRSASRAEE